ncbi:hypothetical protein [Bacteroides sp. 51]|uniref:hypothetical protein n=1 Tax=Bacteroides sp. 51 TaxID=2302938 RepID=UPI0013D13526|nr:hypothetical protein [Bacteroides sp. 51]NDV85045.1 hypothetical protein [Bacteroides sp. 51]
MKQPSVNIKNKRASFDYEFILGERIKSEKKEIKKKKIILTESGKMGLAKTCYDNYCKEYSSLLGEEYKG